jgi:hypothetical protein
VSLIPSPQRNGRRVALPACMGCPTVGRTSQCSTDPLRIAVGRCANIAFTGHRRMRSIFETAGVEFIAENGGGAGVRLKKGIK